MAWGWFCLDVEPSSALPALLGERVEDAHVHLVILIDSALLNATDVTTLLKVCQRNQELTLNRAQTGHNFFFVELAARAQLTDNVVLSDLSSEPDHEWR